MRSVSHTTQWYFGSVAVLRRFAAGAMLRADVAVWLTLQSREPRNHCSGRIQDVGVQCSDIPGVVKCVHVKSVGLGSSRSHKVIVTLTSRTTLVCNNFVCGVAVHLTKIMNG